MSAPKIFTYKEVAEAEGHIIINDKVYDVSEFVNEHPGGDEIIVEFFGQDCTQDFEDIGHSPDAQKTLKKLYVGDVDTSSEKVAQKGDAAETVSSEQNTPQISKLIVLLFVVGAFLIYRGMNSQ